MTRSNSRQALSTALFIGLAIATASPAWAQQYARPDGTNADRLRDFGASGAATAHHATDEVIAYDSDYAFTTSDRGRLELSLSALTTPPSSSNHVLRLRVISTGGGNPKDSRIDVELLDGPDGNRVQRWQSLDVRTSWTDLVLTLSSSNAGSIPSYADLAVEIKVDTLDADSIRVSWVEFEVPSPPPVLPGAATPTFKSVSPTGATLGATVSGTGLLARGTIWNTTGVGLTLPHPNALVAPGPTPGAFTHARLGMPVATRIWFVGYATNAAGSAYSAAANFYTEANPPGVPTFSGVGQDAMTVNWTSVPVTTPNAIVVMKQDSAVDAVPADFTTYTASSTFGVGSQLGTGNYVVYAGPTNQVTVGGLTSGTTYHVALYGYAGIPAMESYNTASPTVGSRQAAAQITPAVLSSPTFTAIDTQSATLGASLDSTGNGTVTERGVVWDAVSPAVSNPVPEGTTSTGVYSLPVSGLPAGRQVFFRAYAANETGTSYSPGASFYTEPNEATGAVFSSVTSNSMRLSWTAGDGDGALVLIKQGSAVDALPTDGVLYSASSSLALGDEIGTGNYVVHAGTGTQVDLTGLLSGVTYWVGVYEFAGSGTGPSGINYQQDIAATSSQGTQVGVPGLTVPTAVSITQMTATLGATLASDGGGTVSERGTIWNATGAPVTENVSAEGGTAAAAFSHARTSFPAGSRIYYRGYAVNGIGTGYSLDASFYTEPTPASGVTFANVGPTTMRISWTSGGGDGAIVVLRAGSAVEAAPADGVEVLAATQFGVGAQLGTGNFVVFRGAGTQVDVSGLTAGTIYHAAVYEYAGSGAGVSGLNVEQDTPASGQQLTLAPIDIPVVSLPTSASVGGTTATLGATLTSIGGAPVTARGTVWNTTGAPIVESAVADGGAALGAFAQARTGFPRGTKIWFRGYAVNFGGTGYTTNSWFHTEPIQAHTVVVSDVRAIQARVSWSAGGGDGVVVVIGDSGTIVGAPVDGVVYTAGSLGVGSQIGNGSVAYVGPANSIRIVGLTEFTTYDVAVFEFAGSGTGTSGINYQQTSPATGSFSTIVATTHNAKYGVSCVQCHSVFGTYVPRDADQETACKQCHNETGAASQKAQVSLHTVNGGGTIVDCGQCHEVHNSSNYSFDTVDTHTGGVTARNLDFIRWNVSKYQPQALEPALFQNRNQFVFKTGNTPYNGVCQTCHTKTSKHTNDGFDDTNGANANTANNSHQQGADCADCHTHLAGFQPGGDNCLACHGISGSSIYDVESQFARASHHVMGGAVTNDDCGVCHAEAADILLHADGSIDLRAPDGGANISVTLPLTRNRLSATLESDVLAVQNDFCLKCHDSDGATVTKFSTDALRPFSSADRIVPDVDAQLDPLQSTFHHPVKQAGSNPYTTSTATNGNAVTMQAPWNQTSNAHDVITCFDCHETTGHGSVNQRFLLDAIDFDTMVATTNGSNLPNGMGASVESFCSRCHSSSVYVTEQNPQQAGSLFDEHGQGKKDHSAANGNELGCMACHGGITNLSGISDNGALPGNLHGSSFTWPNGSGGTSAGTSTEFFLLGGYVNGWDINANRDQASCWGGGCHHNSGSGESYSR